MADQLTDRQREVVELFVAAARSCLPMPTYREIRHELDVVSLNAVADHIKAAIKKGWLERGPKYASRSLGLTDHARRVYGLPTRRAA